MKKTPILILLALLVICVPVAALLLSNTPKRFSPQNELVGQKLVSGFSSEEVREIRIAAGDKEAVLTRKDDGKWVVASRNNYPIDSDKEVERLVASILSLQVGLEIPAEDKHYALMGLLSPDQKEQIKKFQEAEKAKGEENPADPSGLLVTLKGAGDSILASLVFGEDFGGDPQQPLRGIVARDLAGNKDAWKVVGSINRRTGELGGTDVRRGPISEAKSWLEFDFIKIEKIKSITVSAPNDKDFMGWTVTRDTEEGDFVATDLGAEEEMDSGSVSSFKTLFSRLQFEDILDPAAAEMLKDPAKARQAVITTFEGFTYTFDLAPKKPKEKSDDDDEDAPPPPSENYVGTVKIEGQFKETRDKVEGEAEDKAKAEDQAFAVRLDNLKLKLEREKAFEAHVFEFAQWSMSNLLKPRSEIVKAKTPPSEDGDNDQTAPPPFGTGRPSAVTPPVRIPPRPTPNP